MRIGELFELIVEVDVFIGVGTSAQVYPAADLRQYFQNTKEKYFIDPNPAYAALNRFTVLEGTAAEKMPELVKVLCARG